MNKNQFNRMLDIMTETLENKSTKVFESLTTNDNAKKTNKKGLSLFPLMQKFVNKAEYSTNEALVREYLDTVGVDANKLKAYSKQNNLTVSSLEDLTKKVEVTLKKPKKYYDRLVYQCTLFVADKRKEFDNVSLSPTELLSVVNANRNFQGLEPINKDVHLPALSSWVIDKKTVCNTSNLANTTVLSSTIETIKQIFGYDVKINADDYNTTFDKGVINFGSKNVQDPTLISAKLMLKATEFANAYDLPNDLKNASLPEKNVATEIWKKLPKQTQTQVCEDYENIIHLFTVLTLCAVNMPVENYMQIAKVIDFEIGQSLYTLAMNFNCEAVGYLIAKNTLTSQSELLTQFGLTLRELLGILKNKGMSYEEDSQFDNLIELLTKIKAIKLDCNHVYLGEHFVIDFSKVKEQEPYKLVMEKYKQELVKLAQDNFIPDAKLLKEALQQKLEKLVETLSATRTEIENNTSVRKTEIKSLIETNAYCTVSLELLMEWAKELGLTMPEQEVKKEKTTAKESRVELSTILGYNATIDWNSVNIPKSFVETEKQKTEIVRDNNEQVLVVEPQTVKVDKEATKAEENAPAEKVENKVNETKKVDDILLVVEEPTDQEVEKEEDKDKATIDKPIETEKDSVDYIKVANVTEANTHFVEPDVKFVTNIEKTEEKPVDSVQETVKEVEKTPEVVETPEVEQTVSNPSADKPHEKENSMENKANEKLEKEIEDLKQSYKVLQNRFEEMSKQQVSNENVDALKLGRLTDNFATIIRKSLKNSISALANKNLDEIGNKLVYASNKFSRDCATLLAGLNMLYTLNDGDKTVRNMFVALNRPELVKGLIALKSQLDKSFVPNFASILAQNAMKLDEQGKTYEQLLHDTLVSMNNKFSHTLEEQRQTEIDMLGFMYDPDSFEYQDEVDAINAKYFGDDEHYGLIQQLDKCLLSTTIKDIIMLEIARVDQSETEKHKYEFSDKRVKQRIKESFVEVRQDAEIHTF